MVGGGEADKRKPISIIVFLITCKKRPLGKKVINNKIVLKLIFYQI